MNQYLKTLSASREARRESALARLAEARSQFDGAYAACQHAAAEVEAVKRSHGEIVARCALGAGQALRESLLPACESLLQLRLQGFAASQAALRKAIDRKTQQRKELMARERDLLRLAEWQSLLIAQTNREASRHENLEDEELMPGRPSRARVA